MDTSYYVYENWQAGPHKAVVHIGACAFCNHGMGMAGGYDPRHAKWHGPFTSLQSAQSAASSIAGVVISKIHRCVGSSGS